MTSPFAFEFGEQFAPLPAPPSTPVAAPITANKDINKPQPLNSGMTTAQLVRDLKTRLRYVEREIKARGALEKERDQIRRLLKAAKQEKATVHALKRVTS